jgi:hypothetical protein
MKANQRFGGTYLLLFQGYKECQVRNQLEALYPDDGTLSFHLDFYLKKLLIIVFL